MPLPTTSSTPIDPSPTALTLQRLAVPILRRWWMLALFTLVGGLLGLAASLALPSQYETGFSVYTGIEFVRAGGLTQYEEDIMMESVGALMISPGVQQRVIAEAAGLGIALEPDFFFTHARVERRLSTWLARLRHPDPSVAAQLGEAWRKIAAEELAAAYAASVEADGLERRLGSLETCLTPPLQAGAESAVATATPATPVRCDEVPLAFLEQEWQTTTPALAAARQNARGISRSLLIAPPESDLLPPVPAVHQRGPLALAGTLTGLVLGLWAVQRGFDG